MTDRDRHIAQLEADLQVSEAHYRVLYDSSPDAILTIDPACRILACNRTSKVLFGRSPEQLVGADVSDLLEPASGAALTGLLWTGFVGVGESDVVLPDGRRMSFSVARLPQERSLLVLRDISQGRRLETELLRSRRQASLGRLSTSLAHEINNPLAVIQGRLELLQARPTVDPEKLKRQLDVLQDHVRRIVRVTQNLQSFAVPRPPRREMLQVAPIVTDSVSLAGRRLARVVVRTSVQPESLSVFADRDQLAQLLTNLLLTASDASPAGATVELGVQEAPEGGVVITVSDQGRGLSPALLAELRSPYADDDRMVDPGLGLGLAICWAIAQDHDGSLTAENRQPRGARYRVYLPPPSGAATHAGAAGAAPLDVLVVDDDQLLCETITWMLAGEGHRIEAVHSSQQALARLNRREFDIMLIDMRLPGMNGEALVDAIELRWPGMARRVIFASGGIVRPQRRNPYLQKPFTRDQLRGAIRTVRSITRSKRPLE